MATDGHGLPLSSGAQGRSLAQLAEDVAHSLSGLACWPRLVLDEGGGGPVDEPPIPPIVIESRGMRGEPFRSHWQTVLPLLSTRPTPVKAGALISVKATVELSMDVELPPNYEIEATIEYPCDGALSRRAALRASI